MLTTTTAHPPLRLAICGGGASAVLLLASLARHTRRALAVTVFEPRPRLGPGTAYATESPLHLLNVPAARMTTSDDPEGFLRWLRAERPRDDRDWSGEDFAPRALYGEYLEQLYERAQPAGRRQGWTQLSELELQRAVAQKRLMGPLEVEPMVRYGAPCRHVSPRPPLR